MAIKVLFTPHCVVEDVFKKAEKDLLIVSSTIKTGFLDFIDGVVRKSNIRPRLITSVKSESGTKWDRDSAYSDYAPLLKRIENNTWQVRVAKINLRAYCIDRRSAVISTINPQANGKLTPGGVWIHFTDALSSMPIIQQLEYYWSIASDLKASDIATVLQQKGQELGEYPDLPPEQSFNCESILKEEYILSIRKKEYEDDPSENNLMSYLEALRPFDTDSSQREKLAQKHPNFDDSLSTLRYLSRMYYENSNPEEAQRYALLALGKDKNDMEMIAILSLVSNINNILIFDPSKCNDIELITKVVNELWSTHDQFENNSLESKLINICRRLFELSNDSGLRRQVQEKADIIARKNNWHLGWGL